MVVLRLIGDEWKYAEKIAIAVPPSKTFLMCTTQLRDKLQIPSFSGCALYLTEGKPPNYVRSTVPISLQSTPGMLGLKDGALLYVKTNCDATRQQRDREFHEALEVWRKENKIAGILSDGSDVFEFIDDFSSRLHPAVAKDVAEHEAEQRAVVEGEENRKFFVLTFEYREVQSLKDKEKDLRDKYVEDWFDELVVLFRTKLRAPLFASQRSAVVDREAVERAVVERECSEGATQLAKVLHDICALQQKPTVSEQVHSASPSSSAGVQPIIETPKLLSGMTLVSTSMSDASVAMLAQRMNELSTQVQTDTHDLRSMIAALAREHAASTKYLAEAYDKVNDGVESRYLAHFEASLRASQELALKDVWLPAAKEEEMLLRKKQDLLRRLTEYTQTEMDDQRIQKLAAENEAVMQLLASVTAVQDDIAALASARVRERDEYAAALEQATEENFRLLKHVSLFEGIVEQQDRDVDALRLSLKKYQTSARRGQPQQVPIFSGDAKWQHQQCVHPHTAGLHPDVYSVCCQAAQKYAEVPDHVYREVLGYPFGATVRRPDPLSPDERNHRDDIATRESALGRAYFRTVVEEQSLRCASCPYQVADELCFSYRVGAHPHRRKFLRVMDDVAPHVAPVVDLVLDLFHGRELELMVALRGARLEDCVECWDAATGLPYYYHPSVDVTQWHKPRRDAAAQVLQSIVY